MVRWLLVLMALLMAFPARAETLRVAVDTLPPHSSWSGDTPQGEDVTLAKDVAKALGLTPRFIRCTRQQCLSLLERGEADCFFGLKRRPALEKTIWFPDRPLRLHGDTVFWIKRGSGIRLDRHEDLYGKTIGVLKGLTLSPRFDNDTHIERFPQSSLSKLFKLLVAGKVAVVASEARRGAAALAGTGFAKWVERAPYTLDDPDPEFMAVSRRSRLATEPEYVRDALESALDERDNRRPSISQ